MACILHELHPGPRHRLDLWNPETVSNELPVMNSSFEDSALTVVRIAIQKVTIEIVGLLECCESHFTMTWGPLIWGPTIAYRLSEHFGREARLIVSSPICSREQLGKLYLVYENLIIESSVPG